jgi:hypothetical protein
MTGTIGINPKLRVDVSVAPWGKTGLNFREKKKDGAWKSFFLSIGQWVKLTKMVAAVSGILSKMRKRRNLEEDDDNETEEVFLPIDNGKSVRIEKGTTAIVSLQGFKDGEMQKGLACTIGNSRDWTEFVSFFDRVTACANRCEASLSPVTLNLYKWIGVKSDGSCVDGDEWDYLREMAQEKGDQKVSLYLFHNYIMRI